MIQKLLQIDSGIGSRIVDGKIRCFQVSASSIAGYNDPVLGAILVSSAKQYWLPLAQNGVDSP